MAPVEASIEDLHFTVNAVPSLQADAAPVVTPTSPASNLEDKLKQELDYHQTGSYGQYGQCDLPDGSHYHPLPYAPGFPHPHQQQPQKQNLPQQTTNGHRWPPEVPCQESTVQSWRKGEARAHSPEDGTTGLGGFMGLGLGGGPVPDAARYRSQVSGGSLYSYEPPPRLERHQSWPTNHPVPESAMPDYSPGNMRFGNGLAASQEPGKGDFCNLYCEIP